MRGVQGADPEIYQIMCISGSVHERCTMLEAGMFILRVNPEVIQDLFFDGSAFKFTDVCLSVEASCFLDIVHVSLSLKMLTKGIYCFVLDQPKFRQ